MSDAIEIANLRDYPHWVGTVASWHHQEWLSGYDKRNSKAINIGDRDTSRDIREREHSLRTHFSDVAVPSTFVALIRATADDEPLAIGSVSIVYYQFSKHRQPSEWVTNLYVREAFRRGGVGQQLLAFIHKFAVESDIDQLRLYTRDKEAYYRKRHWEFSHKGVVQGNSVSVLRRDVSGGLL